MDLKIKEDIQFEALSAFSETHVKARDNIVYLRNKIADSTTDINDIGRLQLNLNNAMNQYNYVRIQQAVKKQALINSLSEKYQLSDTGEIRQIIEAAITDYENEYKKGFILDSYGTIQRETAEITIPIYAKPARSDMAVILVYFNACSYKKLAQNLSLVYQTLVRSDIPVFLVEHCFKDQVPLFPENGTTIFNTKSDSYMFYKENLINWIMPKIPEQYTKFYMMDCDLLFEKATWYDDVSVLLDIHDIVQPFQTAIWLDSDLNTINLKRDSFAYISSKKEQLVLDNHHPGFAWAARREFIQPKGLFDLNVLGSGDVILGFSAVQNEYNWNIIIEPLIQYHKSYYESFKNVKTTFYSQIVYHLWHGSAYNRGRNTRYDEFNKICKNNNIQIKDDIYYINSQGIYEFNKSISNEFNDIIFNYFKSRNEDGI